VSNLTRAVLGGDLTRAGGAALGGKGDIFDTGNDMTDAGAINGDENLPAGCGGNVLSASDGGDVRPSSNDVLGNILVGSGVGFVAGVLGSGRGGGDLDTSGGGVLHRTMRARAVVPSEASSATSCTAPGTHTSTMH
jgi:hypothetical protein